MMKKKKKLTVGPNVRPKPAVAVDPITGLPRAAGRPAFAPAATPSRTTSGGGEKPKTTSAVPPTKTKTTKPDLGSLFTGMIGQKREPTIISSGFADEMPTAGGVTGLEKPLENRAGTTLGELMAKDIEAAREALRERKEKEAQGIGRMETGVTGTQAGREFTAGVQAQRSGQIQGGNIPGQRAIGEAGATVAGMPGRVGQAAGGQQQMLAQKTGMALGAAAGRQAGVMGRTGEIARSTARKGREVTGSVVADVTERASTAITDANRLFDTSMKEAQIMKLSNLEGYRNMTAQAISANRGAIDAQYKEIENSINSDPHFAHNEQGKRAALAQVKMAKSAALGDLGNKITTHYNDMRTTLQQQYDSALLQNRQTMSGLSVSAREAANRMASTLATQAKLGVFGEGLKATIEQFKGKLGAEVSLAEQVNALTIAGLQMEGRLGSDALNAISWSEQNGAKLATEIGNMTTQLWNDMMNFSVMNDAQVQQTQIAYDQLQMAGYGEMADMIYSQTASYVPIAPYFAALLQFLADQEIRQKTLNMTMMM